MKWTGQAVKDEDKLMVMAQENEVNWTGRNIKNNDHKPNSSKWSEGKQQYKRGFMKVKLDSIQHIQDSHVKREKISTITQVQYIKFLIKFKHNVVWQIKHE